ncbi:MAG: hypothetical protein OXH15_13880 [Gammaproteobacteria bacterium]|nr:hypothetical protein [Gammaproteobacteria bacterium]
MTDLLEIYKLHAELAERAAALREDFTKLYTGTAAAIIGAEVLIRRLAVDSAELAWALPALGIVVSLSWLLSFRSATARLAAKLKTLTTLENELPFDFLRRENSVFGSGFLRRKTTGSVMPVGFLIVCIVWLCTVL